jgi:integrase
MAVYKRGDFWHYKFRFNNQVVRESAKTKSKRVAEAAERERRHQLQLSYNYIPKKKMAPLFKVASKQWLETKRALATKTYNGYKDRTAAVTAIMGNKLICDINEQEIAGYQQKRLGTGLSGRTVNFELACIRGTLKLYRMWGQLSDGVKAVRENRGVGKALSLEDEGKVLQAAAKNVSPAIYPMLVLSLDTGLRASEVRSLRRGDIKLIEEGGVIREGQLVVPKSKTDAGKGRVVPFTGRVCGVLSMWFGRFGKQPASSYVFPHHCVAYPKKGGVANIYDIDFSRPIGEWKSAWRRVLKDAGVKYRWHDLRHTFVSRLAENSAISEQTIREMAGHVSKEMMQRYSHIRIEAKKDAIASLERGNTNQGTHLVKSHQKSVGQAN